MTTTAIFHINDIDAFDSDCNEAPTTSVVFMAILTSYVLNVLTENEKEVVQSTTSPEQQDAMIMFVIDEMSNQVAKCNAANQNNKIMNESLTVELERYKEMVKVFEQRQTFALKYLEKHIDSQMRGITVDRNAKFDDFQKEI
ncbi:hypothetical protein Tco_0236045 [Tanacetum coccineum]